MRGNIRILDYPVTAAEPTTRCSSCSADGVDAASRGCSRCCSAQALAARRGAGDRGARTTALRADSTRSRPERPNRVIARGFEGQGRGSRAGLITAARRCSCCCSCSIGIAVLSAVGWARSAAGCSLAIPWRSFAVFIAAGVAIDGPPCSRMPARSSATTSSACATTCNLPRPTGSGCCRVPEGASAVRCRRQGPAREAVREAAALRRAVGDRTRVEQGARGLLRAGGVAPRTGTCPTDLQLRCCSPRRSAGWRLVSDDHRDADAASVVRGRAAAGEASPAARSAAGSPAAVAAGEAAAAASQRPCRRRYSGNTLVYRWRPHVAHHQPRRHRRGRHRPRGHRRGGQGAARRGSG